MRISPAQRRFLEIVEREGGTLSYERFRELHAESKAQRRRHDCLECHRPGFPVGGWVQPGAFAVRCALQDRGLVRYLPKPYGWELTEAGREALRS